VQRRLKCNAIRTERRLGKVAESVSYQIAGHQELLRSVQIQHDDVAARIESALLEMQRFKLGIIARILKRSAISFDGRLYRTEARELVGAVSMLRTELSGRCASISRLKLELGRMRTTLEQATNRDVVERQLTIGRHRVLVEECLALTDDQIRSELERIESRLGFPTTSTQLRNLGSVLKSNALARIRRNRAPAKPISDAKRYPKGKEPFLAPKVYVLELEGGNYYVGRCTNFRDRITRHISGRGSKWTRRHRPLAVAEIFMGSVEEEKAVTLHYMAIHGINRVRGWVFCKGGLYVEAQIRFLISRFAPSVPIDLLPRSSSLRPQRLEMHPDWERNRHKKDDDDIYQDERGY
jgi:hypothetical protein